MCIGGSNNGGGFENGCGCNDSDADTEETRHHYHVVNFNDEDHQPPWDAAVGGSFYDVAGDDDNVGHNDASVLGGAVNVNECEVNADYRQQPLDNDDVRRNDGPGFCDVVGIDNQQQQPRNAYTNTMKDLCTWALLIIVVVRVNSVNKNNMAAREDSAKQIKELHQYVESGENSREKSQKDLAKQITELHQYMTSREEQNMAELHRHAKSKDQPFLSRLLSDDSPCRPWNAPYLMNDECGDEMV